MTDSPEYVNVKVLSNNTIKHFPTSKQKKSLPAPERAKKALEALNSLQIRRNEPISSTSLFLCNEFERLFLPKSLGDIIIVIEGADNDWNVEGEALHQNMRRIVRDQGFREDMESFKQYEYWFWPIKKDKSAEGLYITAVIHVVPSDPEKHPDVHDVVAQFALIDPVRHPANKVMKRCLRQQLVVCLQAAGFQIAPGAMRRLHVPELSVGPDEYASGLRSYAYVRELMQRLVAFHVSRTGFQETFFDDITTYVSASKTRAEMIGHCSWWCMRDLGFQARVAIEPTPPLGSSSRSGPSQREKSYRSWQLAPASDSEFEEAETSDHDTEYSLEDDIFQSDNEGVREEQNRKQTDKHTAVDKGESSLEMARQMDIDEARTKGESHV